MSRGYRTGVAPVRRRRLGAVLPAMREYGIVFFFLAMFVGLSVATPSFLTTINLLNILDQWSAVGVVACGQTLVILAGGFDLSVAGIYAATGVVAAEVTNKHGATEGIVVGLLFALGLGMVNGILVTVMRVNAFIATLATGFMFIGLATVMTQGRLVSVTDTGFETIGRGELVGDLKYSVLIFVVVVIVYAVVLRRTTFGRFVYAVGGNPVAARLSGIRTDLVRFSTFALCGLGAGIAGIMGASRVSTAQAEAGVGIELTTIAAVVIGGTSIFGGEGAIWRTVLGILLLALIGNAFNILNVEPFYQNIAQGVIIVLAVAIDAWARTKR